MILYLRFNHWSQKTYFRLYSNKDHRDISSSYRNQGDGSKRRR